MSEIRNVVTTLSVDKVIEIEKEDKSISINFTLGGPICHIVVDNTGKDGRNATFEDLTQEQKDELLEGVKSDILDLGLRISILEEEIESGIGSGGGTGVNLYNGLDKRVPGMALDAYQGYILKGLVDTHISNPSPHISTDERAYLTKLKTYLKIAADNSSMYSTINFYSESGVSAYGVGPGGGSGSGSGPMVNILDSWDIYDTSKEMWALSAKLGKSLLDGKKDNFADNYYSKPGHKHSTGDITGLENLSTLSNWFEWDEDNQAIRVKYALYSIADLSAFGVGTGSGTGSGSGGGYERLDDWLSYDASKEGWVLSAGLGYGLKGLLDGKSPIGHTHTINDISNFIPYSHPDYGVAPHTDGTLGHITTATLNSLKSILGWFEWDAVNEAVKVKHTLYSTGGLSAFGLGSGGDGGIGVGAGGTGVDVLTDWASYDSSKESWALSAKLGVGLNTSLAGKQSKLTGTGASSLVRVNTLGVIAYDDSTYLTDNQTITLSGIITGSGKTAITTSIADNALSIAKTSGLQSALNAKMATASYPDLVAIEALIGTSGFLKKINTDTWSLDTNTYLTTATAASTYLPLSGGTLTGSLVGTNAAFSSYVNALGFALGAYAPYGYRFYQHDSSFAFGMHGESGIYKLQAAYQGTNSYTDFTRGFRVFNTTDNYEEFYTGKGRIELTRVMNSSSEFSSFDNGIKLDKAVLSFYQLSSTNGYARVLDIGAFGRTDSGYYGSSAESIIRFLYNTTAYYSGGVEAARFWRGSFLLGFTGANYLDYKLAVNGGAYISGNTSIDGNFYGGGIGSFSGMVLGASFKSGNWKIIPISTTQLQIQYNDVMMAKLDSAGNITATGGVTAFAV